MQKNFNFFLHSHFFPCHFRVVGVQNIEPLHFPCHSRVNGNLPRHSSQMDSLLRGNDLKNKNNQEDTYHS